jgi:hypothetical protein
LADAGGAPVGAICGGTCCPRAEQVPGRRRPDARRDGKGGPRRFVDRAAGLLKGGRVAHRLEVVCSARAKQVRSVGPVAEICLATALGGPCTKLFGRPVYPARVPVTNSPMTAATV